MYLSTPPVDCQGIENFQQAKTTTRTRKIGKTKSYCSVQVEDRQEYLSTETASVAPKASVGKRDMVSNILLLLSFGKLMRLVQLILVGGNQRRL